MSLDHGLSPKPRPNIDPRYADALAELERRRDESLARFQDALSDPTTSITLKFWPAVMARRIELEDDRRAKIMDQGSAVDSFIADVIRMKRADPNLTDGTIHTLVVESAQQAPDNHEAEARAEIEALLYTAPEDPNAPAYLFRTTDLDK